MRKCSLISSAGGRLEAGLETGMFAGISLLGRPESVIWFDSYRAELI